ncbi:hypothetical protein L3Q82_001491 [Scortum barcoo]|uniref:Uncharacterized protein n=1 Tax=Scortum barcoo TaxID=214431 RepID=A0ACB8W783_9TELE|nr:hypothetical protein L3Q82_001491 [Scortum barcoo]
MLSRDEQSIEVFLYDIACELRLDLNTTQRYIKLSDNNRKMTAVNKKQPYPVTEERFDHCQVLCTNGLTDRCYWEVEWEGDVLIAVTYKVIRRRGGHANHCWFGKNRQSWSLQCSEDSYSVWHNKREEDLPVSSSSVSHRVAVYLDCPAGTLSFYRVSSGKLTHLYTFNSTFTEPLYPGFGFGHDSSATIWRGIPHLWLFLRFLLFPIKAFLKFFLTRFEGLKDRGCHNCTGRERVQHPDSLLDEAVPQSAGPGLVLDSIQVHLKGGEVPIMVLTCDVDVLWLDRATKRKSRVSLVQESSEGPDGQSTQQQKRDLDSVFMRQDEEVDSEEEEQKRSSREAFLKITLHFLRKIKQEELADCLQSKKSQYVFEGITKAGNPTLLNQIYTELYITEGGTAEVNDEHEIRQIESASRKPARPETTIRCEDIFKPSNYRDQPIRVVMTEGVAGIGKTVMTQKFTLDWAEDKANQDIQFMFPFTFRELNVLKEKKFSLVELVHQFFTETKEAGICRFEEFQVVFIFDGLDECRLPLDFHNNEILTDVHRVHLSGCAADKPHQGETASLCSPLDNHTTCSSQSDPS